MELAEREEEVWDLLGESVHLRTLAERCIRRAATLSKELFSASMEDGAGSADWQVWNRFYLARHTNVEARDFMAVTLLEEDLRRWERGKKG